MPQAAVRIAPILPAADSAGPGGAARAVAGVGQHPHRRRPGKRAGAALASAGRASAAAGDAPGFRGLVLPVMPVDPGRGGRPLLESQLPKIDGAGRDIVPGTALRRVSAGAGAPDHAAATAALRGSA